ncbi:MAG: FAD binding domain-containing protein [Candidatus Thermoplasmatota archaeon]|nr:FAD binding domain-containing protein [Candidatus Thermoplasmatota archaeon]MEC9194708.1 FAD binding domain-containing protein [Candidatus Thermoplasmatota archaeon]MEE3084725.1 FAD binding domain-containing protein [Candidatus Thermoplasmatota archaeon]
MLMPPFELHHPNTVDEAVETAARLMKNGEAFDWVAGGTDVLPNYKWRINPKPHVISLAGIEETRTMTATELGCTVPLSSLTTENGVHPLLVEAAAKVASSLVRKSATVGGNLCLDTRCFWYNQSEDWRRSIDWCHKADCGTGADCRVIPNQNTLCVATYQGDLAPNFMVLGAEVVLIGPNGQRTLPLAEFYELDGMKKNVLKEGEFLLKVVLPEDAHQRKGCYQKLRVRESWDFPEAGVAASWLPGDTASLKVASTALESIPRLHDEEVEAHLSAGDLDPVALAKLVQKSVKPVNNTALPPRYRRAMVKTLTKRALKGILE